MRVIDFHSHIVPGRYPAAPASCSEPNWPSMEKIDDQHSRMMIAGRQFRVFESFYWNAAERIARLDEEGIAVQVISPLPELLSYWLAPDAAEAITDFMNGFVADMVRSAPARFAGMGSVALQDPARAVRQLEALRGPLGLKGVHVGSHVNGVSIADERFHPFFEAAAALDVFVFVHGIKPGGIERMLGPAFMPAVIGVPHENAAAISSFIMTDILKRYPRLKLVFSHGGGTIGSVIDRFQAVWKEFEPMRKAVAIAPDEYLRPLPVRHGRVRRRLPRVSRAETRREPVDCRYRRAGRLRAAPHRRSAGGRRRAGGGSGTHRPRQRRPAAGCLNR
jgi:aminocarboxymuconate-semialdehyde decarboxylase